MNNPLDLNLGDVSFNGVPSPRAKQMLNAKPREGLTDLHISEVTFAQRYTVMVKGVAVSPSFPTVQLAENFVKQMPESAQTEAQIVSVTADGQQMLLG